MARNVSHYQKMNAIHLILMKDQEGKAVYSQREIEQKTGLSRPYLRKLGKVIGHKFPRNGIELKGELCMCTLCGFFYYKSKSRVTRATNRFCSNICKNIYLRGDKHHAWKEGQTTRNWSSWIKNQKSYSDWRKAVLERDGYKCVISGRTDDLDCHHIIPKDENIRPDLTLEVDNGITINREVHREIHSLISKDIGYEEAISIIKEKYKIEENICKKQE